MFRNPIKKSGLLIAPSPKTASDARIIRFMKRTTRRRVSGWLDGWEHDEADAGRGPPLTLIWEA